MDQIYVLPGGTAGVYEASGVTNPDDWFVRSLSGWGRSDSGISINQQTALSHSSVFSAVAQISGDVARVSLDVYRRTAGDDRERQLTHVAYRLMNRMANRYMTSYVLRQCLTAYALLHGNGYAMIVRQVNGKPIRLMPIHPDYVRPEVQVDGSLIYWVKIDGETEEPVAYEDMLHIKGLGDGVCGYSVIRYARNAMGLGLAAEKHGNRIFRNGATPTVVVEHPGRLTEDKANEFMRRWMERQAGTDNAGRPVLVTGGMKVSPLSMPNDDAQWLETRKFQRVEIAAWFQIPAFKIGDDAKNYNSVEAEERIYVSQTLSRWFKAWESELNFKLLMPNEQNQGWYMEHNSRALIQGDLQTQAAVAVQLRQAMIITQNEARKTFNLNSVEGGDSFENPNTSTSGSMADAPAARSDTYLAHRSLIEHRMMQLTKTEIGQVKRLAKTSKNPIEAIANFYDRFQEKIVEAIKPCLAVAATVFGDLDDAEQVAKRYCDESRAAIADSLAGCPAEMAQDMIVECAESWLDTRPAAVAAMILEGKEKRDE